MTAPANTVVTTTIPAGASLGDPVGLGGGSLVAVVMPDGWDRADLTFLASADGTTFGELLRSRALNPRVTVYDTQANQYIGVDPADFAGVASIRVCSARAGVPVEQTADRVIGLVVAGGAPVAAVRKVHAHAEHAKAEKHA